MEVFLAENVWLALLFAVFFGAFVIKIIVGAIRMVYAIAPFVVIWSVILFGMWQYTDYFDELRQEVINVGGDEGGGR